MLFGRLSVHQNDFGDYAQKMEPGVAGIMRTGMMNYLIIADRLTPVDKGLLKANKTIVVPTRSFGSNPKGKITWNQHYGIYQNYGTVHMPGKHFADRAASMFAPGYARSFQSLFG